MELWTGLACLVADPACKEFKRFGDNGKGAWVNIVASAGDAQNFTEIVGQRARELDCILLEVDEAKLLESRLEEPDYPEELLDMRTTALRQPDDTIFGTFHIWLQSEIN